MKLPNLTIITFFLIFTQCQKEKNIVPRSYPLLRILEITDIDNTGATFNAEIYQFGTEEIINTGFVFDENTIFESRIPGKVLLGTTAPDGVFTYRLKTFLKEGAEYSVKAFVETQNKIIYSTPIKYISKGGLELKISDIEPKIGTWGDTISIFGENMNVIPNSLTILLDSSYCSYTFVSDSLIKAQIPIYLKNKSSILTIDFNGKSDRAPVNFELFDVEIISLNKTSYSFNDTLIIKGKYINSQLSTVTIDNIPAQIIYRTSEEISAAIPSLSSTGTKTLSINTGNLKTSMEIEIK